MSEKNTPEIRLRGFDGFWSILPFAELVDRKSQQTSPNGSLTVEFEDINAGEGTLNKDLAKKSNHKAGIPFAPEDILFGKLRPYLKNWLLADFSGIAVGDFWVLQATNSDPAFIHATIQRPEFMAVANMSSGTKMPRSDWGLVSTSTFSVPSIAEQKSIGSFFRELDAALEAGEKKLEKLRRLKQTMLVKMFPRGGSLVPEVRFNNFSDRWKRVHLGDLGSTFSGLSGKSKGDFGHGKAHYITYLNVNLNPVTDYNDLGIVEIDPRQTTVLPGDILFTTSSEVPEEVGMSSVVETIPANTYLNSFCFGYRPYSPIQHDYWAYMLRSPYLRQQFTVLAQGISRFNISKTKAMNVQVLLPTDSEQQAIGAYFRELDTLLEAEAAKLVKLRQLKSAFLRQMFV
ncbi:restriction endonuclease subunit S [Corynebacterium pelargi]|uniref:EcoKI restriction-modification system protein HsdS n=1 Tax=Corynebacterium pelargi TaxID=1471400 RepID=A0A410WAM7_9CORY|nr:restriction endonuclease subunit S [Corynebacterium pelargi]QAU53005.1 EcoKI restriction-modification system protein HsdS [Corynebacterium pelargi]GGG75494.1 hypothetical protein GCM10007338_11360 [Corynebacterium pelargi]